MGFLLPSFRDCRAALTRERYNLTDPGLAGWLGGGVESHTGETVDPGKALSLPAFFAAVRRIAQTAAMLPLNLMERDRANRAAHRPAYDDPLYDVLHNLANPEQSAFDFWQRMIASRIVYGVAYAEIVRDRFGGVRELWQLRSDRTRVERRAGELIYFTTINGREYPLFSDQVLVMRGFSTWGVLGLIPTETLPDAVAIGLAQQEYYARFFGQNGVPPAVIEADGSFENQEEAEKFLKDFQAVRGGLNRAHRIALLEDGMKFKTIGVSPDTAQLLEGRRFQVEEISRATDCPPQLIYEMSKASYNSAIMEFLSFLVLSLQPVLRCATQEISRSLISPADRARLYAWYNVEALLQMDPKSKAEFLRFLFNTGAMTIDEIRAKLDLNPYPDGSGAMAFVPSNLIPLRHADEFGRKLAAAGASPAPAALSSGRDGDEFEEDLALAFARDISTEAAARANGNGGGRC